MSLDNLRMTKAKLEMLERECPAWVEAIHSIPDSVPAGARQMLTHMSTFNGKAEVLQAALIFADDHDVRVLFVTTVQALTAQADDRAAARNIHPNAIPAEDFRLMMNDNFEGKNGKRPQE